MTVQPAWIQFLVVTLSIALKASNYSPVMMLSRRVVGMQKIPTRRSLTARFRMNKLVTVRMFLLLSTMKHTTPFPTMHTRKISR